MPLNSYFDPVSLERPEIDYLDKQEAFSHHISIHTPDQPIKELDKHQVAIMGVPEDGNGFVRGSSEAPDAVRKFYEHTPENVEGGSASSGNQNRSSHLPPLPAHPVIEPDNSTRRLAVALVAVVLLAGIVFVVMQYVN